MRKNAFTLIELLAVIVILAIIALIATPIVLNIIEDTKKSAQLRGAEFYLDAVEQAIMRKNMSSAGMFKPNFCEVQLDGNLKCDNEIEPLKVEVSGEVPNSGSTITIENGKVTSVELKYGDDTIKTINGKLGFDDSNSKVIYETYANGKDIYFDVTTGKSCTNYHEDNSTTGYNGINPTGNQTSCLKFYAFLDEEGKETINLLLDHNTTAVVAWNSSGSNTGGPSEILTRLYEDTINWNGTITPSDYKMDQTGQPSGANYTITYSVAPTGKTEAYKARLITAQEIAKITGADKEDTLNWKEESSTNESNYCFDSLTQNQSLACTDSDENTICNYGWLYDRTYTNCQDYGCLNNSDIFTYGYWTSSSYADYSSSAWRVNYDGSVYYDFVVIGDEYGARPVITVLKSNL